MTQAAWLKGVGYRKEAPLHAAGFQEIRTGPPHATITPLPGQASLTGPPGLRHCALHLPLWKLKADHLPCPP